VGVSVRGFPRWPVSLVSPLLRILIFPFRSRPNILRPSSTDPRDASNLLQRAGFTLLTVDVEDITISYPSMWELIEDLRDMGESGAVLGRRPFIKRDILLSAEAIYKGQFVVWGVKSWMLLSARRKMKGLADAIWDLVELHGHEDGTVPATFQVIYLVSLAYLSLFSSAERRLIKPLKHVIFNLDKYHIDRLET
jgi:hypothetical protein